jgi:hypothetical protein
MYLSRSNKMFTKNKCDTDKIYIIYQFFVHSNAERNKELQECLRFNVENPHIDKIFLLNEKIYNKDELGVESDKIDQRNIINRIKFKDIFEFVKTEKLKGYIITCNADIFFDKTVNNLRSSQLSSKKHIMAQLRFDYTDKKLGKCKLFGPRADSQDTWIFHSNYTPYKDAKMFNFIFGKQGCDNKLIYLLNLIGFEVFNQPYFVKTYHIQKSDARDYDKRASMLKPYMLISPQVTNQHLVTTRVWGTVGARLKQTHNTTIEAMTDNFSRFMFKGDNDSLREYLKTKIANDDVFFIPQTDKRGSIITGLIMMINNLTDNTFVTMKYVHPKYRNSKSIKYYLDTIVQLMGTPKCNTGGLISFADAYIGVFNNSDMCMGFPTWCMEFRELMVANMHTIYRLFFDTIKNKRWVDGNVTNIFNYIHNDPWISQLNNQKILIISPHSQEIEQQVTTIKLASLYGFDIFAQCEFVYIKYDNWGTNIEEQIVDNLGDFDVALCDCGMYGPIVADYTYSIGKSAVDIGDILPLYFGLWRTTDMVKHKDIIQLYLNKYWKRL